MAITLYKAKDTGRSKAIRFDEEMWSGEEFNLLSISLL
jgi:hypothetical protein